MENNILFFFAIVDQNIQRGDPWDFIFSFILNILFCSRKSLENIKVQFEGLKILKSPKFVIHSL